MIKEKTKKKQIEDEVAKTKIVAWLFFIGAIMFVSVIAMNVKSDTITHKFKSPSFNGIGTSSHYLTIENQEFNRKEDLKADLVRLSIKDDLPIIRKVWVNGQEVA